MTYILASDPGVEPRVENEQEKIDELKEVITRIQQRNCTSTIIVNTELSRDVYRPVTPLHTSQQAPTCFPGDSCEDSGSGKGQINGQRRSPGTSCTGGFRNALRYRPRRCKL